jgi:N-methylhydantoinase A
MTFLVNIDIGGTHTDGVAIDESGRIIDGKVPSTPDNFARGFFDSIELLAEKLDLTVEGLLQETEIVSHGTTVCTNAIIEEDATNAALVTTRGMEDLLSFMRSAKGRTSGLTAEEYLRMQEVEKPSPLIPRNQIYGVSERIDCMGDVVMDLNESQAKDIAQTIDEQGFDSVAISFLWSFLDDSHEQQMEAILEETLDESVFISRSSEIAPTQGEYERTAAAAINAVIGPTTSKYIGRVAEGLDERGYDGTLFVMKVEGGVAPAKDAMAEPVRTIDSGPAAGITGSAYLAEELGHENVIAGDMGGTSLDVGLITDGSPITKDTNVIKQYDYNVRNIDVESIGSGGGSIAWVEDETGRLRVGPESAGATPGPACYGRGGEELTVTDADLLCNFLDPDNFLGGRSTLDVDKAEAAAEPIMDKLGIDLMDVAHGVVEIANAQMADLIQQETINKGRDPREFTVYAYGGAGPLHLPLISKHLDIEEVVIPTGDTSSVWSAVGISASNVLYRSEVSNMRTFAPFDPEELTQRFEDLEAEVLENLVAAGYREDEIELNRFANLSYGMQVHEIDIPVPGGDLTEAKIDQFIQRFEDKYASLYGEGAGASETGFELETIRVDGYGPQTKPNLKAASEPVTTSNPDVEQVYWPDENEFLDTTVYYQADAHPGLETEGPAVFRLDHTTVTVPNGRTVQIDEYNNIVITSE